jgi:glutaconate CoA-transferase subunit A
MVSEVNMAKLKSKVTSLAEAVSSVPDGAHIALGGAALHQHPMAFVRELIRQRRRDLTIVGEIQGVEADMLAGAGCLRRIESSGVGLERFGLARNFRRLVEAGAVEMADYSDGMALDRIVAARDNLPFWPVSYIGGTDIPNVLPELKKFICPVTGRDLYAMPAARIDIAVIHAPYADERGNVLRHSRYMMPTAQDLMMARAAERVFATVEQIVSNDYVRANRFLNEVPAYQVEGVIEAPWGAHPSSMPDFYDFDSAHLEEYVEASKSQERFDGYLERYVFGVSDDVAYLERIGLRNLIATRKVNIR